MSPVPTFRLHHVSIVVTDLERSTAFYRDLFGFERLERPAFKSVGVWLAVGRAQLHLLEHRPGTFRQAARIDVADVHFAVSTDDIEGFISRAQARGFDENAAEDDPRRLLVRRTGAASFPQVYLLDPDNNIIEVNGAAP